MFWFFNVSIFFSIPGSLPSSSSLPSGILSIDLSYNPLGVGGKMNYMLDVPSSVVSLNLDNTSLEGTISVKNSSFNTNVSVVKLENNRFTCPLPDYKPGRLLDATCASDSVFFLTVIGCAMGVVAVLATLWLVCLRRRISLQTGKVIALRAFLVWILGIVDLVSDIIFTSYVLETLRHIKDDPVGCSAITSPEFFSQLVPNGFLVNNVPYPGQVQNFQEYVQLVELRFSRPTRNIAWVNNTCSTLEGLCYFSDDLVCEQILGFEYASFQSLVLGALVVYAAKEAAKACVLFWIACKFGSTQVCKRSANDLVADAAIERYTLHNTSLCSLLR